MHFNLDRTTYSILSNLEHMRAEPKIHQWEVPVSVLKRTHPSLYELLVFFFANVYVKTVQVKT